MSLLQILVFFWNGFLLEAEEGKMEQISIIDHFLMVEAWFPQPQGGGRSDSRGSTQPDGHERWRRLEASI